MKRLILMRHAKSDWSHEAASDHARILNPRGRRSAEAIGDWLREQAIMPDHVICSDAARTRETLSRLSLGDVPTSLTRTLYLAEPEVMAQILRQSTEDCILMVAHNPGTAMMADMLLDDAPPHDNFYTYPTCATSVIDFNIPQWRDLEQGTGQLAHFIVPRELIQ